MSNADRVIEQIGGMQVSRAKSPFLHRKVERLAALAKIIKPRVYVIPDNVPNACAVGLSNSDSAVAITTGLLQNLDEYEIEAVLAHEIGHIQKGHSIAKTKVAMKAMAIGVAAEIGARSIVSSDVDFTPGDDDSDDLLSTILKVAVSGVIATAGNAVASNFMSKDAFQSEFEADECGGSLSGKPWALARALKTLEKLSQSGEKQFAPEVSQLFIISPTYLNYQTHPPTAERIERLSRLIAQQREIVNVPTIFCSSCGEKTDSDGKYCYWCGCELDS